MTAEDAMGRALKKWLIIFVLVILGLGGAAYKAWGHDHGRPMLNDWLTTLHSKNKAWCCDGKDTDTIDDWEAKGDRYRVRFRGEWYDVPDSAIVDGPNRAGDAMLWMNKGYTGFSVRCFMPGTMT